MSVDTLVWDVLFPSHENFLRQLKKTLEALEYLTLETPDALVEIFQSLSLWKTWRMRPLNPFNPERFEKCLKTSRCVLMRSVM